MILIDNNYFRIKIDPEESINLMKTSDTSGEVDGVAEAKCTITFKYV